MVQRSNSSSCGRKSFKLKPSCVGLLSLSGLVGEKERGERDKEGRSARRRTSVIGETLALYTLIIITIIGSLSGGLEREIWGMRREEELSNKNYERERETREENASLGFPHMREQFERVEDRDWASILARENDRAWVCDTMRDHWSIDGIFIALFTEFGAASTTAGDEELHSQSDSGCGCILKGEGAKIRRRRVRIFDRFGRFFGARVGIVVA